MKTIRFCALLATILALAAPAAAQQRPQLADSTT